MEKRNFWKDLKNWKRIFENEFLNISNGKSSCQDRNILVLTERILIEKFLELVYLEIFYFYFWKWLFGNVEVAFGTEFRLFQMLQLVLVSTERKNFNQISRTMKVLYVGNEIIYLIWFNLLFDWSWNLSNLLISNQLKFYSNRLTVFLIYFNEIFALLGLRR